LSREDAAEEDFARTLGHELKAATGPLEAISVWKHAELAKRAIHDFREACLDPPMGAEKAAEWLLDNDYQVARALRQFAKGLPEHYYRKLPGSVFEGHVLPRVYIIAHEFFRTRHMQMAAGEVQRFVELIQENTPLSIAELWALPNMFRIAAIETLLQALSELIDEEPVRNLDLGIAKQSQQSMHAAERVARSISVLRILSEISWQDLVESVSVVERALASDPAQTYSGMDFETRDSYRNAVEQIADDCQREEHAVAQLVLTLSSDASSVVERHVGFWLIDEGRRELEQRLGARIPMARRISRTVLDHPWTLYAGLGLGGWLTAMLLPSLFLYFAEASFGAWIGGLALSVIPASILAMVILNGALTRFLAPRVLPKMDFATGLPAGASSAVLVPIIIADPADAQDHAAMLEQHWLANSDPHLHIVLLADLADADEEQRPEDQAVIASLTSEIERLNQRYAMPDHAPFHLLMRPRRFNKSEGRWLAWERKRGKLEQFNAMVLTGDIGAFNVRIGSTQDLQVCRYAITLDADTVLPPDSVAELAAALAHPLNRPQIDPETRVPLRGHAIIQPRIEISPTAGDRTLFSRLFTGDTAIDIYSQAVSDVYQDLFGWGVFVGKGIYDIRAFATCLEGRVPENAILSHDLFEGAHGRAALATDIVLYENFPGTYSEYSRRLHRWIRGDWQLLAWLFPRVPAAAGTRIANPLHGVDRWKLLDNLRRSLVAPSLVLLAIAGWFILAGSPLGWTVLVVLAHSGQLFVELMTGMARGRRKGSVHGVLNTIRDHVGRAALALVFLLHEAVISVRAIAITLWRTLFSKRHLLEWTTAASVARTHGQVSPRGQAWREMWLSTIIAVALGVLVVLLRPEAFPAAAIALIPWAVAPEIAILIQRRGEPREEEIDAAGQAYLRLLARRTWLFFETFAGPDDHWLPPDNYQGPPFEEIAHRTSPTNIGMLLLSMATAWDLGFIGRTELAARAQNLVETLDRLDRHHGHFFNWYDTRSLQTLEPRYVSVVDSGNLAGAIIAFAAALREAASGVSLESQRWDGLCDLLELVALAADKLPQGDELAKDARAFAKEVRARLAETSDVNAVIESLCRPRFEALSRISERLSAEDADGAVLDRGDLSIWVERLEHHIRDMARDGFSQVPRKRSLFDLADQYEKMAWQMEFAWLYDNKRHLLMLGYNASTGSADPHYYDLLASEARLSSFLAIAKQDVPLKHWFFLGRPVIRRSRHLLLQSWNGSMFEYLMPRLLLPTEPHSLLGESEAVAARLQREYGERHDLPWGISESAFASRDIQHRFQYRAFGVPELGIRRGLAEDTVIAPYASALALAVCPASATANLQRLDAMGAGGRYGLWEAIDFTPERLSGKKRFEPVNAFMAHHQGMLMAAIGNVLTGDRHAARFMQDPRIATVSLLLNERIPRELPSELERIEIERTDTRVSRSMRPPIEWERQERPWPQGVMLGNGRMSSWITDRGQGCLRWQGHAVTRFPGYPLADTAGPCLFVKDRQSGRMWLSGSSIKGAGPDRLGVKFSSNSAKYHSSTDGIELRQSIALARDEDLEFRQVTVRNESNRSRSLLLTWYAEPVLAREIEDERHPAFSKLFVSGKFLARQSALLFRRRPRSPSETPPVALFCLIDENGPVADARFSTDRASFIGRNRDLLDPAGAHRLLADGDTPGLDPAAVLQAECDLEPGEERKFALLTIVGGSSENVLAVAESHSTHSAIDWTVRHACAGADAHALPPELADEMLPYANEIGLLLGCRHPALRKQSARLDPARGGQSALWGLGISGDLPILLLKTAEDGPELTETLVHMHQFWRLTGCKVDLAILQTAGSAYLEPLREKLKDTLQSIGIGAFMGAPGGIHLLFADQIGQARAEQLEFAATAILDEAKGSIGDQLERAAERGTMPVPAIIAARMPEEYPAEHLPERSVTELDFGPGNFAQDGKAFIIRLGEGQSTPAPWANILANEQFGTLLTETGGGFSWAINSGEHRLTSWTNDPVGDRQSEAVYLRDEETTEIWSITPSPVGSGRPCEVVHGMGYSRWSTSSHGVDQEMRVSVPRDEAIKVVELTFTNRSGRQRRLSATYFAEWLLGGLASTERGHIQCEFDAESNAILATNCWREDFAGRVAFLTASLPAHGFCVDRQEFIGSDGRLASPAALGRWGLSSVVPETYDPCAAYQVHLDLAPSETISVSFVLGEAKDRGAAIAHAVRWRDEEVRERAGETIAQYWDGLADTLQVETPDPKFDLMVNRWLLYQSLSSRVFGRCGFYQASGAYGFRDQLQDVLALLHAQPELARAQIIRCAQHQFEQGDVLHWWHPPAGRGVRTRFSDDLHWLTYAVGTYVSMTGDETILTEEVDFLASPPLSQGEADRYDLFPPAGKPAPIIEHCELALERVLTGLHGLPLMGSGDWNDGMDRVGVDGRGESVWLGWFASQAMDMHADMLGRLGRTDGARYWLDRAEVLRSTTRENGWDGDWFRRAFDDRGKPLGAAGSAECEIDSIAQSWARFALGKDERATQGLRSAWERLVDEEAELARLLWPPFDLGGADPGYIAAYPKGVRENGGQYNHAAAWFGLALAMQGDGDRAYRIFRMISPAHRMKDAAAVERYRIEPYVVAGDICTHGPLRGQGGWSWYSGAASWSWRLAVEGILGLRLVEGRLQCRPNLPHDWNGFSAVLKRPEGTIELRVDRRCEEALATCEVDGIPAQDTAIKFPGKGKLRKVTIHVPATDTMAATAEAG